MDKKIKIVVGVTGASGAIYAHQLLSFLQEHTSHEVSIVASSNGLRIFSEETKNSLEHMGYPVFKPGDFNAPFVSGSARYDQMIIIPCSMGTLGRIAHGISDDAITRTADVFLKEKRKLILVPRETPFSLIHIENLRTLHLAGATIIPAIPSYYSHPQTIDQLAQTVTSRVLDHMSIDNQLTKRWMQSQ